MELTHVARLARTFLDRPDGRPDWLRALDTDPTSVYYRFLYEFARDVRPAFSLEIGTCEGKSAAHLAAGNPEGLVVTLDIKPEAKRLADALLLPNLVAVVGDSIGLLERLKWVPKLDVLFVDGDHTFRNAYGEYIAYRLHLRDGGLVFFDDIAINDGMRRMWDSVVDPKEALPNLHYTGFGVARKDSKFIPRPMSEYL